MRLIRPTLGDWDRTVAVCGIAPAAVVLRELAEPSGMAPGSLAALCLTAIPENLGYRQVRNLWLMAGYFGAPAVKKRKQAVGKR